ncbi:hypothetical protein [Roseovarius sp. EL26]|uniref:hypothetical protein n=1 Tax=Roseovarius sp. EL26 TaxID=2126672 RepID=UPI000EA0FBA4|nr:hypothetical protein [Roseovarius sp. EL26]
MFRGVLLFLVLLAACGRPLTSSEVSFASQLYGESLNINRIRVMNGALIGKVTYDRQKRPRLTCRERILPEPTTEKVTVSAAAIVLHNKVFFSKDWFESNFLPAYPERFSLIHAMLFAHELAHVWQWQNRALTGYSPFKAAREHSSGNDPYLFDVATDTSLLDYGYEQQASIVEEYVCCATLDPTAPRTKRLETLLRGSFPLQKLSIPQQVALPWGEAQIDGICR